DGGAAPLDGDDRGGRVAVLAGDVRAPRLGLEPIAWQGLARRITHIVHAAADLRLTITLAEARRTNADGVAHLLELARSAPRLARLLHVSTAYVAGRRPDEVAEDDLSDRWGFANAYEHSKYEGERLIKAARAELPVTVVRPAMIVGDTHTGAVKTFNTVYVPLRRYLTRRLRVVPTRPDLQVNIVPVDWVADAIMRLTFDPAAAGQTVHLTAPPEALPRADELLGLVRRWAADQLGVRLPRPLFIPLRPPGRGRGQLAALLPYLTERRRFRRDHADRLLGPYAPDWRVFLPRLLAYASAQGFLHRGGRTVHEQILFRLAAKSRPLTYQDIAGTIAVARDPGTVRGEMLAAAGALERLGAQPGDRVALVGVNSTRYLTLDVAVGLAGAVSVPLHPTSPPAELDEILAASAARLLLVGAPDVLARLAELRAWVPVVSFCPGPAPPGVVAWDDFLALGAATNDGDPGSGPIAPVGPDDLTTIRYTSGTTGQPKGVAFTHRQLAWMAQTMAGLL
ncbi:MAG TPA: SDR family oxidoreductase, partial [Actinomycetota bacterium]|nr:SDR family oxidoreductase [Actinomycetota bacterium]